MIKKLSDLDLLLINPYWLVLGIIIYLILTSYKVYLIWYVQPKIFNPNQNIDSIFKNQYVNYFKLLCYSPFKIIKPTLKYIFTYKEKDFLIVEIEDTKQLRKRINILNSLLLFLKPYLIFAFIWMIMEVWISSKFLYQPTKITLGEIQLLLNFIDKIPFVNFLYSHKALIILLYGIVCVVIPYLYQKEKSTKKYKNYITQVLVYLSLIANISFFGIQYGKTLNEESKKLKELESKITKIHDRIFIESIVAVSYSETRDSVNFENTLYKNEILHFEDEIQKLYKLPINEIYLDFSKYDLKDYSSSFRDEYTIEDFSIPINPIKPDGGSDSQKTNKVFNEYYNKDYRKKAEYSSYGEYMGNTDKWNVVEGEDILKKVRNVTKEISPNKSDFDNKFKKILEHFFEYGLDITGTEIFKSLDIESFKVINKVGRILITENYRKALVEKVIKFLDITIKGGKNNIEKFLAGIKISINSSKNYLSYLRNENKIKYKAEKLKSENEQLIADIKNKIDELEIIIPEKSEIIERLKNRYVGTYYENNANLEFELGLSGFSFSDLEESIIKKEKDEFINVLTNFEQKENLEEYNSFLKKNYSQIANQSSNISLTKAVNISKIIGVCGSDAKICIKCGLPCIFPVCLAKKI